MITSVKVSGLGAATRNAEFPFRQDAPVDSSYYVDSVDGLGPTKADLNMSAYPTQNRNKFNSSRVGGHQVVLNLGYDPDLSAGETVETLRRNLYTIVPPEANVRLTFVDSILGETYIEGHIESAEPDIFSKEPRFVVTFVSEDSYFSKYIPAPTVATNTYVAMPYTGTAPTQLLNISLTVPSAANVFNLWINNAKMLEFAYNLKANDFVQLSLGRGYRQAVVNQSASMLDAITLGDLQQEFNAATDSIWIGLLNGTTPVGAAVQLDFVTNYVGF